MLPDNRHRRGPKAPPSRTLLLALGLTVGFHVVESAAEVYRWEDRDGNVHFGDRPPGDGAVRIEVPPPPPLDRNAAIRRARGERLTNAFEEDRKLLEDERDRARNELQAKQAKCEGARKFLWRLEHAGHLFVKDDAGEKVILDDNQHANALAQAREAVEAACD